MSPRPNRIISGSTIPVPPRWRRDVEKILITDRQLARRVKTLARQIERDYRGREIVVIALLNGTVLFLADLIRHLSLPLRLDFIGVSSYGSRGDFRRSGVYQGIAVGCARA